VEEIQAKIVLEGKNLSGTSNQGTNATSGKYETATSATNLGCLTNTINTVIWDNSITGYSISPTDNIRIKVIANLRRLDATDNTQNILFVATYPAILSTVSNIGTTSTCSSPLQQPESATTVYNFCSQSIYTSSDRFLKTKRYEDLVKELENSERLSSKSEDDKDIQLYPNPTNDLITIDYILNKTSNVRISIVNSTGNNTRVILNEIREAGKHEQKINVGQYTSGLYILILEYNNVRVAKKFVVNN